MEIKLILPDNLKEIDFDNLSSLLYVRDKIREEVKKQLTEACVEYAVKNHPEITFDEKEIRDGVKERLIDKLADKALSTQH